MLPQDIVIVPIYFEQTLQLVNIASGWKNALEMAHARKLLF